MFAHFRMLNDAILIAKKNLNRIFFCLTSNASKKTTNYSSTEVIKLWYKLNSIMLRIYSKHYN